MKNIILALFCILIASVYSQETVFKFTNSYKSNTFTSHDEVLPIVNSKNNDISIMFIDKRKIYGYLIDETHKIIDSLSTEKRPRKYKIALGNSISKNNDYSIYLTNNAKSKFASINFSYKEKKTTITELDLKFTDENLVQSVSVNNNFYLISVKANNQLNIYSFDEKVVKKHSIDLSSMKFMGRNMELTLGSSFNYSFNNFNTSININKLDENSINALEQTSGYTKMYVRDNQVIFTFDKNNDYTQILTIDLKTYKATFKKVNKIYKFKAKNSNSYLFEDKIFQVSSNSKKLFFLIKDYKTADILAQYTINIDEPILFKNTPIIQYGGAYANKRILKKTKQYLRKVATANIGIAVNRINNKYLITLGGYKEIKTGGAGMGMGFGIPMGSFGGVSIFFNPAGFAYNSYSRTKSVSFKTLLDTKFEHLKESLPENAFDLIKNYQDNYDNPQKGESIFKYKEYYILGHYNFGNQFYQLHKFINE